MMFVWIIQVIFDLVVVGAALLWLRDMKLRMESKDRTASRDAVNLLREKIQLLEEELRETKTFMENELRRVGRIVENVNLTQRASSADENLTGTEEATELLELIQETERNDIPSVRQLERTKERVRSESRPDLKTLLCEQLS